MEKKRKEPIIRYEESKSAGQKIIIENAYAEAEIYLRGAHLTHFQPKGENKVIFDGKESYILPPKSAHFGIPVCWPWFGPHPSDSTQPQHGFARNLPWEVEHTLMLDHGETQITLSLESNEKTLSLWDYPFKLQLIFTIGKSLWLELVIHNCSDKPMTISQALHSYLYVENSGNSVTIHDLKSGGTYTGFFNDSYKKELATHMKTLKVNDYIVGGKNVPVPGRTMRRWLKPILDRLFNQDLDIKDTKNRVVIHTLRHTFASQLAIAGTPILTIQKLMNHADIAQTMRYAKLAPDQGINAVKSLYQ